MGYRVKGSGFIGLRVSLRRMGSRVKGSEFIGLRVFEAYG